MKKSLSLGCAAVLSLLTGPSLAAGTHDATVSTTLGQSCTFTTSSIIATIPPVVGETNVGNIGFSCNFVSQAIVTLNVQNGTFLRSGANKVRYEIKWEAESPEPYYQFSPNPVLSFQVQFAADTSATANVPRVKPVWVKLDQAPTIAGTYSSIAVYTISP